MTGAVLFYHSVFDADILAILDRIGCQHFVEIPKALAQDVGERRFGTHIYPGTDSGDPGVRGAGAGRRARGRGARLEGGQGEDAYAAGALPGVVVRLAWGFAPHPRLRSSSFGVAAPCAAWPC